MARNPGFQTFAETQKLSHEKPFVWLFEFQIPTDPPQRFRVTSHDEPVEYGQDPDGDPLVYNPAPIAHQGIPDAADGSLPSITITLQDVLGIAGTLVDDHDGLIGMPIAVRVLSLEHISLQQEVQTLTAQVQSASILDDGPRVALTIGARNVYQTAFPRRLYTRTRYPALRR